jgi:hypothetical protein
LLLLLQPWQLQGLLLLLVFLVLVLWLHLAVLCQGSGGCCQLPEPLLPTTLAQPAAWQHCHAVFLLPLWERRSLLKLSQMQAPLLLAVLLGAPETHWQHLL